MMSCSIVIVGVGGQGTLLASKILSSAASWNGLFVRTSETIGMAQRGGSVSGHLRIGAKDLSPVIPLGHANLLLGFELSEAVRHLDRLASDGCAVVNTEKIVPTNVALNMGSYFDSEYVNVLKKRVGRLLFLNASDLAKQAGSARAVNVVMLGAACGAGMLPFSRDELLHALRGCVKERTLAVNEAAFNSGFNEALK